VCVGLCVCACVCVCVCVCVRVCVCVCVRERERERERERGGERGRESLSILSQGSSGDDTWYLLFSQVKTVTSVSSLHQVFFAKCGHYTRRDTLRVVSSSLAGSVWRRVVSGGAQGCR